MTPPLIVSVSEVARRIGLQQPLDEDTRWAIEQVIVDAQADVSAYLGRPLTPTTYTETGLVPWMGGYDLQHAPVLSIVSETAETDTDTGQPTGLFTVVYTAGIDAATNDEMEPIRRYVRTHAIYAPSLQALVRQVDPDLTRKTTAVSVEGQSITYQDVYASTSGPGSGAPGALPVLASLDRWRIAGRRVSRRRTDPSSIPPWPYDYTPCKHWGW